MLTLPSQLENFVDTINDGPDALHPSLFCGPIDRVMLGLKAHANTISHARLVALEQTFPLTRQHLGEGMFHRISRDFTETAQAKACDSNAIGQAFAAFLGNALNDPTATDLARIEWAWLESYHAPDADPMTLGDLSALEQADLLELRVTAHPSARLVELTAPISESLPELAGQYPRAILLLCPDAAVQLIPLNGIDVAVFIASTDKKSTLGNLLAAAIEHGYDSDPLTPITLLIGAGALVKTG